MAIIDDIIKRIGIEPKFWANPFATSFEPMPHKMHPASENIALYTHSDLERIVAEMQAENKVLRDALEAQNQELECECRNCMRAQQALATPSDHSAIDAAIRQAKIDSLNMAATWFANNWHLRDLDDVARVLRRMASELKGE